MESGVTKNKYTKIITIIVICIIGIICCLFGFLMSHPNKTYLYLIIKFDPTKYPVQLDEITILNQLYIDELNLVFPYTVTKYKADEYKKIADLDYLHGENTELNCTKLYDLLSKGYNTKHIYYGNDNKIILSITVTKDDCNNLE